MPDTHLNALVAMAKEEEKLAKPRNERTSFTLDGVGQCAILFNLTGSIAS